MRGAASHIVPEMSCLPGAVSNQDLATTPDPVSRPLQWHQSQVPPPRFCSFLGQHTRCFSQGVGTTIAHVPKTESRDGPFPHKIAASLPRVFHPCAPTLLRVCELSKPCRGGVFQLRRSPQIPSPVRAGRDPGQKASAWSAGSPIFGLRYPRPKFLGRPFVISQRRACKKYKSLRALPLYQL